MQDIEELRKEVLELKERVELMEQLNELKRKFDQMNEYKRYTYIPVVYPSWPDSPWNRPPWITYTSTGDTIVV